MKASAIQMALRMPFSSLTPPRGERWELFSEGHTRPAASPASLAAPEAGMPALTHPGSMKENER